MPDSFFTPLGDDRFLATPHTVGPWAPDAQHGGPPSALLARALERCAPRDQMTIARVTVELLGPVPIGELRTAARVARPGRSVEMLEATLSAGGRDVARATAWRVRRAADGSEPDAASADEAFALPPHSVDVAEGWGGGYLAAMEWRPVRGGFGVPGPATVWMRMRHPLVSGEQPTPLQRVMISADTGNGISHELDLRTWLFINPELTVHLHRMPVGEWICVDATTAISPGQAGLATSVLGDVEGPIGAGAQALLIAPR